MRYLYKDRKKKSKAQLLTNQMLKDELTKIKLKKDKKNLT